jgi:hypothetical protein
MNNDCLSAVTQYLQTAEAVKISRDSVAKNFPKKVVLKSFRDVDQFLEWGQCFDMSNLEEVTYQIYDMSYDAPRDQLVGWVPHGVKVLRVDIYNEAIYAELPETVEELHLGRVGGCELRLPDHIKRVTLEAKFDGTVVQWPAQLEDLVIKGWKCDGSEDRAYAIDNLPEGLKTMYLDWGVPVEVKRWPTTLALLTLVESEEDRLGQWLDVNHADVPEEIAVTRILLKTEVVDDYEWQGWAGLGDANDEE